MSEFLLLRVRREDSGVFHCSASNPAGVASANLTIEVVDKDEEDEEQIQGGSVPRNSSEVQEDKAGRLEEKQSKEEEEEEDEDSMIKVGLIFCTYLRVNNSQKNVKAMC